jgi:hypothetical protein
MMPSCPTAVCKETARNQEGRLRRGGPFTLMVGAERGEDDPVHGLPPGAGSLAAGESVGDRGRAAAATAAARFAGRRATPLPP